MNLLRGVVGSLQEEAKIEAAPTMEGRFLTVTVNPIVKRESKAKPADEQNESTNGQKAEPENTRSRSLRPTRQRRPGST